MTQQAIKEPGSWRDPQGHIYHYDNRIFRTVLPTAKNDFDSVYSTGLIESLIKAEKLLPQRKMADNEIEFTHLLGENMAYILEHPKLPFVSYPFEWPFSLLKKAALLQLDIQLEALEYGITLSDASAYNIQFLGSQAIFIDHLSFRPYKSGELWAGYRQFCEQFLNPLLLLSKTGLSFHAWYRGQHEGISANELRNILPWHSKLSWNVFCHVVLHSSLQKTSASATHALVPRPQLPLNAFKKLLTRLKEWIITLNPPSKIKSTWSDYTTNYSHVTQHAPYKHSLIQEFIRQKKPGIVLDLGCNTGVFSETALKAGADYVIGLDNDNNALELAHQRAQQSQLTLLPLVNDLANPTPSQGFAQRERKGLLERSQADALFALAIIHHMAIAANIPLSEIVDWFVALAPSGLIEFVDKSDPMVQELLRLRTDIFNDYSLDSFLQLLKQKATIVKTVPLDTAHRTVIWYEKK
jgi:ribosomal protein L11 methylase PrmA